MAGGSPSPDQLELAAKELERSQERESKYRFYGERMGFFNDKPHLHQQSVAMEAAFCAVAQDLRQRSRLLRGEVSPDGPEGPRKESGATA